MVDGRSSIGGARAGGRGLVLGSASPRRRAILEELGVPFAIRPSQAAEPAFSGGDPVAYATSLAVLKAEHVLHDLQDDGPVVLAADTIVVVDEQVLGKPVSAQDAMRMLSLLQGRSHQVITAVTLRGAGLRPNTFAEHTHVWFRPLCASEVARYTATGEGADKAGAYAIQGLGTGLVERIEGSYSNVVGLPAAQTLAALQAAAVLGPWP